MEKDTNPKDALGTAKWRQFMTVPRQVLWELGVAMLEGALKYGRHNYRASGVRASVYLDAAYGHLDQFCEGEDIDKDSGLSHITKAMASLAVLRDAMMNDFWTDDRPPKIKDLDGVRDFLQGKVAENFERYADKNPHHYTHAENGAPYQAGVNAEIASPSFNDMSEVLFGKGRNVSGEYNQVGDLATMKFSTTDADGMPIKTMELDRGDHVRLVEDTEMYKSGTEFVVDELVGTFNDDTECVYRLLTLDGEDAGTWSNSTFAHVFKAGGFVTSTPSLVGERGAEFVLSLEEAIHMSEDWNAKDPDFDDDDMLRAAIMGDMQIWASQLDDPFYMPYEKLDILSDDDPTQILRVARDDPEYNRAHVVEGLTQQQFDFLEQHEVKEMRANGNKQIASIGPNAYSHENTTYPTDKTGDMVSRRVLLRLKAQPRREVRLDFPDGGFSERSTRLTDEQWVIASPGVVVTEKQGASPFPTVVLVIGCSDDE